MIIFKRKHLSIKWGIFAGILVFLAILLLLLFLLQTVYLDDIYKAAKKNTLNNANDKVEQVLEKQLGNLNVIEQQHFYKRAKKMAEVLQKKSQETFSVIHLICLKEMKSI